MELTFDYCTHCEEFGTVSLYYTGDGSLWKKFFDEDIGEESDGVAVRIDLPVDCFEAGVAFVSMGKRFRDENGFVSAGWRIISVENDELQEVLDEAKKMKGVHGK